MGRSLKYEIPGQDARRAMSHVAEVGWEVIFEAGCGLESIARREMVLEIGFGRGEFLLAKAAASPEVAFVGIEVSFKRSLKMARKLARAGLRNVRLLEARAEVAVRELFEEGQLGEIWVNFSDPWPKARHAHRRLIRGPFVSDVARLLATGGMLYVATDDVPYAHQIDEVLAGETTLTNRYSPWPFLPDVAARMRTGYEERWREEGRPMHFFAYCRNRNQSKELEANRMLLEVEA